MDPTLKLILGIAAALAAVVMCVVYVRGRVPLHWMRLIIILAFVVAFQLLITDPGNMAGIAFGLAIAVFVSFGLPTLQQAIGARRE